MDGVRLRAAAAALLLTLAPLAAACDTREKICADGRYPAKAVGNTTGRTCVDESHDPPAGYVRYPPGKVPAHVDDEWDRYWKTVVVDEHGNVVPG